MPTNQWLKQSGDLIVIEVLVSPKAKKNKIVGLHDGCLKIRIAATPTDGKANTELIKFLAKSLGIPSYWIKISSGHTSKRKTLDISGITKEAVEGLLE